MYLSRTTTDMISCRIPRTHCCPIMSVRFCILKPHLRQHLCKLSFMVFNLDHCFSLLGSLWSLTFYHFFSAAPHSFLSCLHTVKLLMIIQSWIVLLHWACLVVGPEAHHHTLHSRVAIIHDVLDKSH